MRNVKLSLSVALLFVLAPCALAWAAALPRPGILNEEAVMTDQRLSGYDTLVIKDFSTDGVTYERIDDEERPKVEAMKPLIVKNLTTSIESAMKKRNLFKNIVTNTHGGARAVILEGTFTEFNGGSRALRFWVGMGAGKTYLKVKGRLIDAQSGKELATFEDQESGYRGAVSMDSFEELFPHQATSLGEHIGEFVEKLY